VGPPAQYDFMGATQFRLLTALGLREEHAVLDVGCGSLRAGRLLLPYLLPDRYHGIEPNAWLVADAIERELGADLVRLKRPRFDHNDAFDPTPFGRSFDFIVAQSIFSHTGPDLTGRALAGLARAMHPGTMMLATFVHATPAVPETALEGWIYPHVVAYERATVQRLIAGAGLLGQELPWFHPRQSWYLIAREAGVLLSDAEKDSLSGAVLRDDRFPGVRPG
jgi:SAM-dependent methyltransferase